MKKIRKKGKNTQLIRSFITKSGLKEDYEDYEVWVPYYYHGVLGFIDLVVQSRSEVSLFKFKRNAKDIESAAKQVKLETKFFSGKKKVKSKTIRSHLVFEDNEKNRKAVLDQEELLVGQPFEILFFNRETGSIEPLFEHKERLPRLFLVKNTRWEEEALNCLLKRPNHEEIEEAIMNLDEIPEVIDEEFVGRVASYIKKNDRAPEDSDLLREQEESWTLPEESKQEKNRVVGRKR